ncbi:cellulase family glycosylhydrolase [Halorhabdus amylolytica]|uniref:cellulase family glycosylhydrolase n=1 Tax=Halorhabdus amylolytica TaxID=2559573 RepID=UPI0010AA2181
MTDQTVPRQESAGRGDISATRRRFLAGVASGGMLSWAVVSSSTVFAGGVPTSGSGQSMPTPRLHVEGKWLKDPNGDRVSLYGLNTVDPYWGRNYQEMGDASYGDTLHRLTDPERGWHPRVIRVPVQHSLESVGLQRTIDEYLRPTVDLLGDRGCYVILDYHQVERWDTEEIDQQIRTFWNAVAPAFADDEHVLFELFNEPTKPSGDGRADWDAWRETAQPWVDQIRLHAPETPIIVGSPRWSSYVKYADDNPFEDENILYSVHLYPGHFESYDVDAIAAAAEEVPLFVTEWGYVNDDDKPEYIVGTTSGFGESIAEYFDSIPNVNWTAWCADSLWSPAMFDTDGSLRTGDRYMGGFVKQLLADN